jgi:uncharacterized protein YjbJ (UPF0337 family)
MPAIRDKAVAEDAEHDAADEGQQPDRQQNGEDVAWGEQHAGSRTMDQVLLGDGVVARCVRMLQRPQGDLPFRDRRRSQMSDGTGDKIRGTLEETKGGVKQGVGDLTGDDRMKSEGMLDEAKGKAQNFLGDLKDKVEDIGDDLERKNRA